MKSRPLLLLLLLSLATCAQARELGRLFFTPEQRMQLESGQLRGSAAADGTSSSLVINGIVQKHGGKRTIWVNGVPQTAGYSNEQAPATTTVLVPGKTRPVEVKVGQKLLLDTPAQASPEQPNQ
jgi:hypothetical protein